VEKARFDKMLGNQEVRTIITALGSGVGNDVDLEKLRYHKVIIMTDADVDGSHIRTLLLTFFYRQMRGLLDRGFLYIAQPPLYRIKKGKEQRYLQDEKELTAYLMEMGVQDLQVTLPATGESYENARLGAVFASAARLVELMARFEKRHVDSRVVLALTLEGVELQTLMDPDAMQRAMDNIVAYLKTVYPEAMPVDVQMTEDEEHSCTVAKVTSRKNGSRWVTEINPDLLKRPKTRELKRLAKGLKIIGTELVVTGAGKDEQGRELLRTSRIDDLVTFIMNRGRKGVNIQRYKGLGEMNPEQLWETTMDPKKRSLLRVSVEDVVGTDDIFSILMGDAVEPRREFIETNALSAKNLDI